MLQIRHLFALWFSLRSTLLSDYSPAQKIDVFFVLQTTAKSGVCMSVSTSDRDWIWSRESAAQRCTCAHNNKNSIGQAGLQDWEKLQKPHTSLAPFSSEFSHVTFFQHGSHASLVDKYLYGLVKTSLMCSRPLLFSLLFRSSPSVANGKTYKITEPWTFDM